MKLNKKLFLLPLIAAGICLPLSSCATTTFNEVQNNLGLLIDKNMQREGIYFNNFAFFGGSDIAYNSYDLYENRGYRSQIELFEDYVRHYGPYNVSNDSYANYIYGKRLIFDFSKPDATIQDVLNNFDQLTESNKILTTVYNVDTKDITDLSESDFKDSLKQLIEKSLKLQDNSGMIIIKTHYQTNDQLLNQKINANSDVIKNLIATDYGNDLNKLQRIGLVDHCELTKKNTLSNDDNFVQNFLTKDNKLNAFGQLEMLYETISSLYKETTIDNQNTINYLINTSYLTTSNILYRYPTHSLSCGDSYVTTVDETDSSNTENQTSAADKIKNFQEYLSNLPSANWQFFGDSLTYAGVQTWGYKGYVDYLRWILKNEFNRINDSFLNEAVFGGRYVQDDDKYGEYSFPKLTFTNYATDILYVMMGTNDIVCVTNQSTADTYISENIEKVYNDFKETNKNGWMIVSTIPYFYSINATTMKTIVDKANTAIKTFAASKNNVIFIDNNSALNNVVTKQMGLTTENAGNSNAIFELYAEDKVHFNTNAYIIMTKNILSNLNFDYSKSSFMDF